MKQFTQSSEAAMEQFVGSLGTNCLKFRGEPLPQGFTPSAADIGFEQTTCIRVLLQRGVTYTGTVASLQQWAAANVIEFATVHDLWQWLNTDVQGQMALVANVQMGTWSPTPTLHPPLTNMAQVTARLQSTETPFLVDDETLLSELSATVKGQHTALMTLSTALAQHIAKVAPERPLTLFATGPTGVGKTRTGETMADTLNRLSNGATRYEFLRLDMCEYHEEHRVSQLLGAPQGYVAHADGAQLPNALSRSPHIVVLFDEIEKAHPSILKALMNAMDAGRLSTASAAAGSSHEVDCRKAIFFFSSNLDSEAILVSLQQREALDQPMIIDEVCRSHVKAAGIPAELVGRISYFLVYRPLSPEIRAEITMLDIQRVAREYGLKVGEVDPQVIVDLVQKAGTALYGARSGIQQINNRLGKVFMTARRAGVTRPIRITGPAPYRGEPVDRQTATIRSAQPTADKSLN